jgi:hypothetical protein
LLYCAYCFCLLCSVLFFFLQVQICLFKSIAFWWLFLIPLPPLRWWSWFFIFCFLCIVCSFVFVLIRDWADAFGFANPQGFGSFLTRKGCILTCSAHPSI